MTIVRLKALVQMQQLEEMVVPMVTRTARAIVWSEIEISVGILCANVPGMWALCRLRNKKRPSHQQRYERRTASAGKATGQSRGVSYLDIEEGSILPSSRKGSAISQADTLRASAAAAESDIASLPIQMLDEEPAALPTTTTTTTT
jgi:hypothetical protein